MAGSSTNELIAELRHASQQLKKGRRDEALAVYETVKERAGTLANVQLELGNLCREIGDVYRAIPHYRAAAEAMPDDARCLRTLGLAYLDNREHEQAREMLERASRLDPNDASVQHGLAATYMNEDDYEQAIAHLERACELKPSDKSVRTNLAASLNKLSRHAEALPHARKAVKLDGGDPGNRLVLSETLAQLGELDEATRHLEQIVRKHPTFGLGYDLFARIRKFSKRDEPLIRKAEKALEAGMLARDRLNLHFALGKMHDDCGHYDEAFSHYERGNRLRKRDFDLKGEERLLRNMRRAFSAKSLRAHGALGHASAQPVFIVGMPRSGTTLMERIIASHPRAAGAGELTAIPELAETLLPAARPRLGIGRIDFGLTREKVQEYAEDYLRILRRGLPEADRIVDKLPGNFYFVGLIKTLFPHATVLHSVRHPLDTCLSCYFQSFTALGWSNDLTMIGKIYALYRKAMQHWSEVLPPGSIVDVRYEELVQDPETQARRLLDACNLEWDGSVLEFFRRPGIVRTASVAQVRQPIYKSSRMRWVNYARHLGPLITEIAPFLEEDRALLQQQGLALR